MKGGPGRHKLEGVPTEDGGAQSLDVKAGAGHNHEDKGSFVLEFAGETFAMDPGTCDYSNPLAEILSHCERHNM